MTKSSGTSNGNCIEGLCYGEGVKDCTKRNKDNNCECYASPEMWKRLGGCPINQHLRQETKVRINPLKASKRARRKR